MATSSALPQLPICITNHTLSSLTNINTPNLSTLDTHPCPPLPALPTYRGAGHVRGRCMLDPDKLGTTLRNGNLIRSAAAAHLHHSPHLDLNTTTTSLNVSTLDTHPHAPPLPALPAGVLGTLAGGVLLDKLGATLRNGNLICCGSCVFGLVFALITFNATHSFVAFLSLFAITELLLFCLQVRKVRVRSGGRIWGKRR